jgi:hypothetical protein
MTTFWIYNPAAIFDIRTVFDIIPSSQQTYTQNINAVSRLIILLSLIGAVFTGRASVLVSGLACLVMVSILYKNKSVDGFTNSGVVGIASLATPVDFDSSLVPPKPIIPSAPVTLTPDTIHPLLESNFDMGTPSNPFSNVLLTDIGDNPNKLAAPPAFNATVGKQITDNIRENVKAQNEGVVDIDSRMAENRHSSHLFNVSNRIFHSTPNTRVTNDQGAFAQFLYGDMASGKESNAAGSLVREERAERHILR